MPRLFEFITKLAFYAGKLYLLLAAITLVVIILGAKKTKKSIFEDTSKWEYFVTVLIFGIGTLFLT